MFVIEEGSRTTTDINFISLYKVAICVLNCPLVFTHPPHYTKMWCSLHFEPLHLGLGGADRPIPHHKMRFKSLSTTFTLRSQVQRLTEPVVGTKAKGLSMEHDWKGIQPQYPCLARLNLCVRECVCDLKIQ